jgi:hypothetical protein
VLLIGKKGVKGKKRSSGGGGGGREDERGRGREKRWASD